MADIKHDQNHVRGDKKYRLDRICLHRFKLCLKILFPSYFSDSALLFILLLGLALGQQLVVYNVGLLPSDFIEVLGEKDRAEFHSLLVKAFSLVIGIAIYNSAVTLVSKYLYLNWRRALSNSLHQAYFSKSILYFVNVLEESIDNIDQRITQDVDRFSQQLSQILAKLIISPLTIIYYSVQCFNSTGYTGPIVIYTYFIVGTVINKLIMSSIVNLVFKQEKFEGDFRFKHTQIRSFAESVAFLQAEKNELKKVTCFFEKLLSIQRKIVHSELFLNFSTNLIDYLGSILSYIMISVPIFTGKYDNLSPIALSSLISKNAFVSIYLISCFSSLIDLSSKITDICGYSHRIGELVESLNSYQNNLISEESITQYLNDNDEDMLLKLDDISYCAPNSDKQLASNLNLTVHRNKSLLITGNTGAGKSSLVRILANLWKPLKGEIRYFTLSNNIVFLPQKPFLTNGSLIDQVIYPSLKSHAMDYMKLRQKVSKILEDVGLYALISRIGDIDLEPCWHWSNRLSPGEVQRLSFARLFYHQPKLAVLDEATSALGIIEEDCFYTYCQQLGITVISVGHRETLKQYHDNCLKIKGDGKWEYYSL